MKRNILITIGAVTLAAITINASAGQGPYLSPRAAGNQIKHSTGVYHDPDLVAVDQGLALPPRAAGNQIVTVASTANDVNPVLACVKSMNGSPKAIQACVQQPATMPGCNSKVAVAPLK